MNFRESADAFKQREEAAKPAAAAAAAPAAASAAVPAWRREQVRTLPVCLLLLFSFHNGNKTLINYRYIILINDSLSHFRN